MYTQNNYNFKCGMMVCRVKNSKVKGDNKYVFVDEINGVMIHAVFLQAIGQLNCKRGMENK